MKNLPKVQTLDSQLAKALVARRVHQAGYANNKEFIGWDGEGITFHSFNCKTYESEGKSVCVRKDKKACPQSYVLFGNSVGMSISSTSLGTKEILELLLNAKVSHPNAIFVGYSLNYDFNMILRDLSVRHRARLYKTNVCRWQGYRISIIPGKWMDVASIYNGKRVSVRLYDVFGFFQASFVEALSSWLGTDDPDYRGVVAGKKRRSLFDYSELDTVIRPYMFGELRLLVRLMEALRADFLEANIPVSSWHGPGAVANKVFQLHKIGEYKGESPKEVSQASQYAYAGGRFEQYKLGYYGSTVYEYDIRSAYPSIIARLPCLHCGYWEYVRTYEPDTFGIWNIEYDGGPGRESFYRKEPLFVRDPHGRISYPNIAIGWYWSPEAAFCADSVRGGWVYRTTCNHNPFDFVPEQFETRAQWKLEGNSAQKALKLALNSYYGKMAQRVGSRNEKAPKWHQLEWAGYVTSATRATLFNAILLDPSSIISTETDALFSVRPLKLAIGTSLGEWELTEFSELCYIQSGLYYGTKINGEKVEKYRGFDKGSLPFGKVLDYLADWDRSNGRCSPLSGYTTRFIGLGKSFATSANWCSWPREYREVALGGDGKRGHVRALCPECRQGLPMVGNLHTLANRGMGGRSYPHTLPWEDSPWWHLTDVERWDGFSESGE